MNILLKVTLLLLLFGMSSHLVRADEYHDAILSFRSAGESADYFEKSIGYAIFPDIGKAGAIIGAAHGSGRVYRDGIVIGTSDMTQMTLGLQLGFEGYSQIIFFENDAALNNFAEGNFEFSADASAVAITAGFSAGVNTGGGASAGASGGKNNATTTSMGYRKGMAIFTVAKGGLMYQLTLGGQKYSYTPL